MTATPLSLNSNVSDDRSTAIARPQEPYLAKYILLPSALGGLTKIIMEVKDSTNNLQVISNNTSNIQIDIAALGYLVPANIFLGVISGLIGTFVLSDFVDLQKSKYKIFGLSLLFGLFFPTVFNAASNTIHLQNEIGRLQERNVQVTEIAVRSAMPSSSDPLSLETAIQNIESLAVGSEDLRLQEMAIHNIGEIVSHSRETPVARKAVLALVAIAQSSPQERVVSEAIKKIEKISLQSNHSDVRTLSLQSLEQLGDRVSIDLRPTLDEAIRRLSTEP